MITSAMLFDVSPIGSPIAIFLAVAFFFICLAVAVIAFKMMKKTVKMAVRMAIVAVILIVALIGSIAFFIFGGGPYKRPERDLPLTPTPTPRKVR